MAFRRLLASFALVVFVGACADSGDSSNETVDSANTLQLSGAASIASYACNPYTVSLVDGNKAPQDAKADVTVALSGLGSGKAYVSLANCQGGSATDTVTLPKGQSSAPFFYSTTSGEALTFSAAAKGFAAGSLAVTSAVLDVIGQAHATGNDSVAEVFGGGNMGVFIVGSKTLVVDSGRSRVLIWNGSPAPHSWADLSLGQPSPGVNISQSINANTLSRPQSGWSDGNRVVVADTANSRVLVWNQWPTTNAQPADFALGQAAGVTNLSSNTSNVASASSLSRPAGVWSDGTHLFVADSNNHRVLVWNAFPTTGGQPADVVLGQTDMNSGVMTAATATSMSNPVSVYTSGTKLFVADGAFNRVLVWNSIPTQSNQAADFALGQPNDGTNLTGSASAATASGLYYPAAVSGDGTHLFVVDENNHRVLVWNSIPSSPTAADFALGQAAGPTNLTTHVSATTAGGMSSPTAVASDGNRVLVTEAGNDRLLIWNTFPSATQLDASVAVGVGDPNNLTSLGGFPAYDGGHFIAYGVALSSNQLFVADTLHHRILVWNSLPTSPSQPADFALGQAAGPNNLTDVAPNANAPVSASGLADPAIVKTDGVHLFVADYLNARVLIWNHLPTAPVPADVVLGKPALDANTAANSNATASTMGSPWGIATDGNMLFAIDRLYNRILVWNNIPTQSGQAADFALGHAAGPNNLTASAANDGNATPSASTLSLPYGVDIVGGKLYVADSGNGRVLVYNTLPTSGGAAADFVLGAADLNTVGASTISASTIKSPISIASANNHLYVSDYQNNRVMVWNTIPTTSGTPADAAIGQVDLNSYLPPTYPTANTLYVPVQIATDGARLFICDSQEQRLRILPTR